MGYTTNFVGELKFATELTASQLAAVSAFMGADVRDHKEWSTDPQAYLYYIDLELLPDFSGVKWSGAEKTSGMVEAVNLISREMRKQWPDFRLVGQLSAQGEDFDDRWTLAIDENGNAHKQPVVIVGQRIECPHCGRPFIAENGEPA